MIKNIFHILIKRILLISVTTSIFIAGSVVYIKYLSVPTYKATVQLMASDNVDQLSVYSNLFTNGTVFKKPISKIVQKKDSATVANGVNTLSLDYTAGKAIFTINATSSNPIDAAELANIGAAYFASNIGKYMLGANVAVLSKASVPESPILPKKSQVILIALVCGVLFGMALALIKELFINKNLDQDYVNNVIGFNDLGSFAMTKRDNRS